MNVTDQFTLEEIVLIKSCDTNHKDSVIQILEKYMSNYDPGMTEIIQNALGKLRRLSEQDFIELIHYPI